MSNKIIKSELYKYPTLRERNVVNGYIPEYLRFTFEQVDIIGSTFHQNLTLEEASRKNNLHYWNITLSNRLGKLKETQIFLLAHYKRGFVESHLECDDEELVDHILFDYYSEIFYYFFFSTRDILAQLLNIYFNLSCRDDKVTFERIQQLIQDEEVSQSLDSFYTSTEAAKEFRNRITHRFPITQKDHRSEVKISLNRNELTVKDGNFVESEKILNNISKISIDLSTLLNDLNIIFEKNHF